MIFLFQAGAPSQIDLFDPKPKLREWNGKSLPESLLKDLQLAFVKPTAKVLASRREFRFAGESGIQLSEWLPHTATIADEICLVRSVHGESINHHPGQSLLMTGSPLPGRPTIGSWVTYGSAESRAICRDSSSSRRAARHKAVSATGPMASCRRITRVCFCVAVETRSCACRVPTE